MRLRLLLVYLFETNYRRNISVSWGVQCTFLNNGGYCFRVTFFVYLIGYAVLASVYYLYNCSISITHASQGVEFPWLPKPVEDLAVSGESNGFHIQDMPSLIVFMEAADDVDQKEVSY